MTDESKKQTIEGFVMRGKNGEYYVNTGMFIYPVDQIMTDIYNKDIKLTVEVVEK